MPKKLLLVITPYPVLSKEYAYVINALTSIEARPLNLPTPDKLLLLLKGQFNNTDSILLSLDTFSNLGYTIYRVIAEIREVKPNLHILVIGDSNKMTDKDLERLLIAGASGIYMISDDLVKIDLRRWVDTMMKHSSEALKRVHQSKPRTSSPDSNKKRLTSVPYIQPNWLFGVPPQRTGRNK
jgi:hypothetical protein